MKMTRILTPLAFAVASTAASAGDSGYVPAPAAAPAPVYEAGSAVVRIGASHVNPDEDSDELNFAGVFLPDFEGSDYSIDSDTTWNFSAAYFLVDHFAVEFVYVGESDHDTDVDGFLGFFPPEDRLHLGDIERRSSSLYLNWFPVCKESWVQPYVGAGIGYTDFDDNNAGTVADAYFADTFGAVGPATLEVKDDWGWTGQVGVDVMLGRDSNWLVNAAVQYMDVDTSTRLKFPVPGAIAGLRAGLDFDPWIYNLGIGYKF
ncbi:MULTISPECIES: OmpW family outer membrane protein [unclassified Microbulbifer]|uniref:OmpW/AlkL family protein n=1 Tax=unclassified Microbulbifer TaxID=2619833 RepID=UPI0027E5673B|nr:MULTISPECIES: OmpW family outer membrane protein [unclassified Microbulbifer]